MKTPARDLVNWIKASVTSLALSPSYGSMKSICAEISAHSGVSVSAIQKIVDGRADNPTADTIDKLIPVIQQATRKAVAE